MKQLLSVNQLISIGLTAYITTTFLFKIAGGYPSLFSSNWWMFIVIQLSAFYGMERAITLLIEWFRSRFAF